MSRFVPMASDAAEEGFRQLSREEIGTTEFIERCTRSLATQLGCSRVGLWTFQGKEESLGLRCRGLYDNQAGRMKHASTESGPHVVAYLCALMENGHIVADDVLLHPATRGLFRHTPRTQRVRSLMAACFSVNGVLHGAFSCTQLDATTRWTPSQLTVLKRVCAKASLALAVAARTQPSSLMAPL